MSLTDIERPEAHAHARVVAIAGSILGVAATLAPGYVSFRPNRILDGTSASALHAFGPFAWVLLSAWVLAALVSAAPIAVRAKGLAVGLLAGSTVVLSVWRIGVLARDYLAEKGDIARLSLGLGFWLSLLAAYLVIFASTAWLSRGWERALVSYLPIVGVMAILFTGGLSSISIMREYANNADDFAMQFQQQLAYVIGATLSGIVIGVPLGVLAARRPRAEPAVFAVLNILEVLPVLAFIGLLNPVLAGLSVRFPVLADLGIRPVGWAPVLIVLTAYAIYPIARNVYTAMTTLDEATVDAARGIGMGTMRRLFEVELPLAAPTIVAGIRIAVVQTTAGAIIAGLVGGGGLGTFVFLGASQTATDLVLLGTIPIVALALFFDRATLAVQKSITAWSVRT